MNSINENVTPNPVVPSIALRTKEAAIALGISERTLNTWRKTRDVPHFKLNGTVLYPVKDLTEWVSEQLPEGDAHAE